MFPNLFSVWLAFWHRVNITGEEEGNMMQIQGPVFSSYFLAYFRFQCLFFKKINKHFKPEVHVCVPFLSGFWFFPGDFLCQKKSRAEGEGGNKEGIWIAVPPSDWPVTLCKKKTLFRWKIDLTHLSKALEHLNRLFKWLPHRAWRLQSEQNQQQAVRKTLETLWNRSVWFCESFNWGEYIHVKNVGWKK